MNLEDAAALVDEAIEKAGKLLDMDDWESLSQEEQESAYEDRHHCGVCQTRVVMETVWPALKIWVESSVEDRLTAVSKSELP